MLTLCAVENNDLESTPEPVRDWYRAALLPKSLSAVAWVTLRKRRTSDRSPRTKADDAEEHPDEERSDDRGAKEASRGRDEHIATASRLPCERDVRQYVAVCPARDDLHRRG
jgi:hypothetical protein